MLRIKPNLQNSCLSKTPLFMSFRRLAPKCNAQSPRINPPSSLVHRITLLSKSMPLNQPLFIHTIFHRQTRPFRQRKTNYRSAPQPMGGRGCPRSGTNLLHTQGDTLLQQNSYWGDAPDLPTSDSCPSHFCHHASG